MSAEATNPAILEREFLPLRAKILEIAASLDRIQRASGDVSQDARIKQLRTAIEKLLADNSDRAEQIQLLFSRPYEQEWRELLEIGS